MRAFVAVAKTGSFSAAAQKLDLVPSVVTKRVTQLERIVGKTLFHRTTRKVVLSPDGEHHLERVIAAIAAHDQALTELRKGVRRLTGPIRIKVPSTLGFLRLNSLVREFAELHPDVDVEVLLLDGPMNPAAEGIDIAITAFPASFGQCFRRISVASASKSLREQAIFVVVWTARSPAPARGAPLPSLPTHRPDLAIPQRQRRDDGHRSPADVQQ